MQVANSPLRSHDHQTKWCKNSSVCREQVGRHVFLTDCF